MLGGTLELVLEVPQNCTEETQARFRNILSSKGTLEIIETEELLQHGRVMIPHSRDLRALDEMRQALEACGGRISIVTAKDKNNLAAEFADFYLNYVQKLNQILQVLDTGAISKFVEDLRTARTRGSQIFIIGNGGSAATASHMANDLAKQRFGTSTYNFRVLSLTDNLPLITAIANDEGFNRIFVNQLRNLMQKDDLVIAISSSGNSRNVIEAVEFANQHSGTTWGISGFTGGELNRVAKSSIHIPTKVGQYGFHEDVSMILTHIVTVFLYERDREEAARNS